MNEAATAQAPVSAAPAFARARVAALAADGNDKTAAMPRLKTMSALAEAVTPRVDRLTTAARMLTPTLVAAPATLTSPSTLAAATATAMTSTAATVESQISDQLVQSMRMQWQQGGGEATIELNPNYLGKVQIAVRVEHGAVSASVQAETPLVREWLATHREELTQTLSQQGLRLEKLDIAETAKEQPTRDNTRDPRQPQRDANKPRRDADERRHTSDTFERDLQENS